MERKQLPHPSASAIDKKELGSPVCEFSYWLPAEETSGKSKERRKIKAYQNYLVLETFRSAMEKLTSTNTPQLYVPLHLVWLSQWCVLLFLVGWSPGGQQHLPHRPRCRVGVGAFELSTA